MADYKQIERNRAALRQQMTAELKSQGLVFKQVEQPQPQPNITVEETAGGRRIVCRDICGYPTTINVRSSNTVVGDCLVLSVDSKSWTMSGSIVSSSVTGSAICCGRLFTALRPGIDAVGAVLEVINDAGQTASLKL